MDKITPEKLDKYFDVTSRALAKVKIAPEQKIGGKEKAEDFLDTSEKQGFSGRAQKPHDKDKCTCKNCQAHVVFDMAKRYFEDAGHFREKGDVVNAFACLNYAHGWLDAGARLGLFDVEGDSELFTIG